MAYTCMMYVLVHSMYRFKQIYKIMRCLIILYKDDMHTAKVSRHIHTVTVAYFDEQGGKTGRKKGKKMAILVKVQSCVYTI